MVPKKYVVSLTAVIICAAVSQTLTRQSAADRLRDKPKIDINSTQDGAPIISWYVENGMIEQVKNLMKNPEVNIEQPDWVGNTAFTTAAERGKKDIFELLLPKANILHKDNNGQTALMGAIKGGYTEIVRTLLNDPRVTAEYINAKDKSDKTALKYAQEKGNAELVELLKNKGATE